MLVDDGEHVDPGGICCSEHLHDVALRIDLAVLPAVELCDDFLTDCCAFRRRNIERPGEARVVCDNVIEIRRLLKGADNGCADSLDDPNDTAFLTAVSSWAPVEAGLMDKARHDAIAMECGAKIISGDKEILPPLLIRKHVAGSAGMDLQFTCEEIRSLWQNVVILANPNNATSPFQSSQCLIQERKITPI
jgi:hypothetical protein